MKILGIVLLLLFGVNVFSATYNISDYGGVGDEQEFYVNIISNSLTVVAPTKSFATNIIGQTLIVFQGGAWNQSGTNLGHFDFMGTVTNVSNGTNLLVSPKPLSAFYKQAPTLMFTTNNAWATLGTDNTPAYSNALAAASADTNADIHAGDGRFFCDSRSGWWYGSAAIVFNRGGITFSGNGETNTMLVSSGACFIGTNGTSHYRSFLVEQYLPSTNITYPVIFKDFAINGGVQVGNQSIHGIDIDYKGDGWDQKHTAFLITGGNAAGPVVDDVYFTNMDVGFWRGEQFKSQDQSTNGIIHIHNCFFHDGCATALNVYQAWDVSGNIFSNLWQTAEFYQAYAAADGFFKSNIVCAITGNGFAVNGGKLNAAKFTLQGNIWWLTNGNNGIQTEPGANISILNEKIYGGNYLKGVVIGAAGSQGSCNNSNIFVADCQFSNVFQGIECDGYLTNNLVQDCTFSNNTFTGTSCPGSPNFSVGGYGIITNVTLVDNTGGRVQSSQLGGLNWFKDNTNNAWSAQVKNGGGELNFGDGTVIDTQFATGNNYWLNETAPIGKLTAGQIFTIKNSRGEIYNLYHTSSYTGAYFAVTNSDTLYLAWDTLNNQWVSALNVLPPVETPPTNFPAVYLFRKN